MSDANIKIQEKITQTIKNIVGFMDLECDLDFKEESEDNKKALIVSIQAPDNAKFLIGKDGQNLKAIEHLVRMIILKTGQDTPNIVLDVNDYRKSRTIALIDSAKQAVTRVRNTQKAEALAPMSAYERRIVHMELAAYPDIATESVGDGLQRRVIIKPYP